MPTAIIRFSDNTSLTLSEGETIIPVLRTTETNSDNFSYVGDPVQLENHITNGLIPSIAKALLSCNFFYVNNTNSSLYCTYSIVKIESV